ncbi:winged helix-turn-helix domain-containing protein [Psychrosphaera sp. B3R10]|uniref:winged helix-turn-helix transcriptional regulator n=1 Tax=unclassified Psychrosphaera TaxID=2641570 RepID=UPI001C09FE90|nr:MULTISPECIES: winged helix-turn-helix domain-containing protein [unclassified Psychrosphaera]MBU2880866.1 winged helix-turn-helix domain-containing protein [Psychrosphaera sp. I2R16]MBU2990915.1 winged helix-turn-helix domain-containing protein [Psychrosphaera sp. B3R10]
MNYEFGGVVVDTAQVTLSKNAKLLNCEPRVFALLVYFCQHPQEAISREELLTHVWDGRIVSDAAVNRAVGELRKLIEDDPSKPQWIKTISKVGYKFTVLPAMIADNSKTDYSKTDNGTMPETVTEFTVTSALTSPTPRQTPQKEAHASVNQAITSPVNINYFWAWLTAVLILIVVVYLQYFAQPKHSNRLGVEGWQPVTTSMGSSFNPDYDSSSETALFLYRKDPNAYAQIYKKNKGKEAQSVTDDEYYYTDVIQGNDGAIFASRLNNLQQRNCEIVKIVPATLQNEHIMDCGKGTVTQLEFDQKFNQLFYQYRPSVADPYAIYSYQLDTGRKRQITHPLQQGNTVGDYVFALSPNSKVLAVVEYSGEADDKIKLVDISNNQVIATKPFINSVYGLVWRTNKQLLASNADGLYEFTPDNLNLNVTEQSDQYGRLALGQDNNSVLTERSQLTINIFQYSDSGKTLTPLTTSRGVSLSPIYGNKSNLLAFKSDRTGQEQVYIKADGEVAYVAAFHKKIEFISAMAWSQNDEQLVASINGGLYVYSVVDNNWQAIAEQFNRVHHVTFADRSILFSAEVDGQWNIWQYLVQSGEVKQLTTKGGYSVQEAGNKIYLTKFNREGLYELNLKTNVESALIPDFPITGWRHWQLRENKIFYLLDQTYVEFDLSTGTEHTIYEFRGRKPYSCNKSFQMGLFSCDQVEFSTSHIWQVKLRE